MDTRRPFRTNDLSAKTLCFWPVFWDSCVLLSFPVAPLKKTGGGAEATEIPKEFLVVMAGSLDCSQLLSFYKKRKFRSIPSIGEQGSVHVFGRVMHAHGAPDGVGRFRVYFLSSSFTTNDRFIRIGVPIVGGS